MSVDRLHQVAEAADASETYEGPWSWVSRKSDSPLGTELLVGSEAEMGHIADVVPWMPELAQFIATFDPPTVKALLDVADAAEAHRRHVDDEWFRLAAQRPQDPKKWERWESERERLIREMADALARLREVMS